MAAPDRRAVACTECGYVVAVKTDGSFGKHHLWSGTVYLGVCPGSGRPSGLPNTGRAS